MQLVYMMYCCTQHQHAKQINMSRRTVLPVARLDESRDESINQSTKISVIFHLSSFILLLFFFKLPLYYRIILLLSVCLSDCTKAQQPGLLQIKGTAKQQEEAWRLLAEALASINALQEATQPFSFNSSISISNSNSSNSGNDDNGSPN